VGLAMLEYPTALESPPFDCKSLAVQAACSSLPHSLPSFMVPPGPTPYRPSKILAQPLATGHPCASNEHIIYVRKLVEKQTNPLLQVPKYSIQTKKQQNKTQAIENNTYHICFFKNTLIETAV
jgi:hypothetical protein